MDIFYLIASLFFIILGVIGSFLPIIPGPLTGWFGFLFLYQIEEVKTNKILLLASFLVALCVFIFDYISPLLGAKIFGGSKKGIVGASIGLFIGVIFFGPFGLLLGSFLGAIIGEMYNNTNYNLRLAFKASLGTFTGIVGGFVLKLTVACSFFIVYAYEIFRVKELIFNILFEL